MRVPKSLLDSFKVAEWEVTLIRKTWTDTQRAITAPHWLGRECDPGRTSPEPWLFDGAVLWIGRTGGPWLVLPEEFGKWSAVFKRVRR